MAFEVKTAVCFFFTAEFQQEDSPLTEIRNEKTLFPGCNSVPLGLEKLRRNALKQSRLLSRIGLSAVRSSAFAHGRSDFICGFSSIREKETQ